MDRNTERLGKTNAAERALRVRAREFCQDIVGREAFPDRGRHTAFVLAHADDEVIGYGTIIAQLPDAWTIHVTDSAPKVPTNIGSFDSAEDFKNHIRVVRRQELNEALNIAGQNPEKRKCLGVADQDATNHVARTARTLAQHFRRNGTRYVMTHAYEGGHPDHDAVAVAVHFAKKLLAEEGTPLTIIEAPFYKGVPGNEKQRTWQEYADGIEVPEEDVFLKTLNDDETALKRRLYGAHRSQGHIFPNAHFHQEQFRLAPQYDFFQVPNNGHVTNIYPEFGLTPEKWRGLVSAAQKELGI